MIRPGPLLLPISLSMTLLLHPSFGDVFHMLHGWDLVRGWFRQWVLLLGGLISVLWSCGSVLGAESSPRDFALPGTDRPVEVKASFHLLDLLQIDDEAETFEFSGVMSLMWKDERQAFNPAEAGVAEKLYHGSFQFNELSPSWYPQVILANASQIPEAQGVLLRVAPDGTCTLIQDLHAVARKDLKLRRYPFDRQRLEAVFQVLGFDRSQVVLSAKGKPVSADIESIRVPQWHLRSVSGGVREIAAPYQPGTGTSSAFVVSIDVRRQSFFVVRLVFLPLLIVVGLSWCVFWMDRASLADRMSVTFVGLLTAVAYQAMIGDIMPHISYTTFINAFISLSFLLMSATALVNLQVCLCDRRGDYEQGDRIDRRCRWIFPVAYLALILFALISTFYIL